MTGAEIVAACVGGERARGVDRAPERACVDSREVRAGDLFFGLRGENADGGRFAAEAARAGAWGAVVTPEHASELLSAFGREPGFWLIESRNPLSALQGLAREWRRRLGSITIGITGSAGKTTTKDVTRALLPGAVHASRENWNTEIGLPLTVTEAPPGVDFLVLEMAMRGAGQIAELTEIAEPDIGLITNVGPVHTELLGSIEAVAAAKAELLDGLSDGAPAIVPAKAGPLEPELVRHLDRLESITFGEGGHVEGRVIARDPAGLVTEIGLSGPLAERASGSGHPLTMRFELPFSEPHNLTNLLAAVAVGVVVGTSIEEMAQSAAGITFSRLRGELVELSDHVTLINDCYNANPISMRAALDHLGEQRAERRLAVLGLMAELGDGADTYHAEVGAHARTRGVDLLIGVGHEAGWYEPDHLVADADEAAELLADLVGPGDTVLVKGSRSVGLERVAEHLERLIGSHDG